MTKMIFHCMEYGLLHSETSYNVTDCSVFARFTCFQWDFGVVEDFLQEWDSNTFAVKKKKLKLERMS